MAAPSGKPLSRLINRLLDLPHGDGLFQVFSDVLFEVVTADSAAILQVNPATGTARILAGTGLRTPDADRHEQFKTPFFTEHIPGLSEAHAHEFEGPFLKDPFLDREGASSLLVKGIYSGEEFLAAVLLRRETRAYTLDEVEDFSAVSGVIGTLMLLRYNCKKTGFSGGADDETGLGLFSDFHQSMVKELSRARRNSANVTMGIMSIDAADPHPGKDPVFTIASVFQKQLRDFDTLDRYGSKELVFILPELRSSESVRVLERVVRDTLLSLGERDLLPDIYVGLSCYPEDGATVERLIEMAEAAMNKAVEGSTPGVFRWTENGEVN